MAEERAPDAALAELLLAGERREQRFVRTMLATVTSIVANDLLVRPDSMTAGDVGPLFKLSSYTPAVNDRVLCLWLPDSQTWVVLGKVVPQ